ncbi:MAG: DUF1501 domain-containing protein [Chitinophagales bacterium]
MKRRDFLKAAPVAAIPALIGGWPVKAFGASPLLEALTASAVETDHVLVLIQMVGGNDGLNCVIPLDQYSNLSAARSNILIAANKVLPLNGVAGTGLHPSMTGMQQLFNDGKLRIVQGVGYPNPNFSHFRATDIWLTGSDANQVLNTGWSGRHLAYEYTNYPTGYPNSTMPDPLAIQIGYFVSPVFQGPQVNMAMSIADPSSIYNLAAGIADPAPANNAGKELTYVRQVAKQTNQYASVITSAYNAVTTPQLTYPANNQLAAQLKAVARLIAGGLKTRVYLVSTQQDGSYDTHANQVVSSATETGEHADMLGELSAAIKAFQDDLQHLGAADRVLGMTFSEFGRRIKSNASLGTDHGAAAPVFVFGNQVLPGISGTNPQIGASVSVDDNLPMQYDFRSVYGSLLRDWFCVPESDLPNILFQQYQNIPMVNTAACTTAIHEINSKAGIQLITNYPNPFTSATTIQFTTAGGPTLVQIFNCEGQLIKTPVESDMAAGTYSVQFENEQYSPGVYYARFQNGMMQQVAQMMLVR